MEEMRKPDQGQLSAFILGTLFFLLLFGAYASMFLVGRRSSQALDSMRDTFARCYESIQNQQLAEAIPGIQADWLPVDLEAMDTAVERFKELSAILWMPRSKSPAIVMDIVWNDWKEAARNQPLPQYESRQLLHAIRLAGNQLGQLNRSTNDAFDLVIFLSGLLFSLGTAGSIAFYSRLQQSRLKEEFAADNLKKALESEDGIRKTIAMELHDDIAQDVAAARMLCERAQGSEADVRNLIHRAALTLGEVNHKIRILCTELRPPALEELGLNEAIRTLCDTESERRAKSLVFLAEAEIPRLPTQVEGNLFRIIREAIINAVKHTTDGDAEVRARINQNGKGRKELVIEVRDHGSNNAPENRFQGSGLGLTAMRERAEQIGAELLIKLDSDGSLIRVTLGLAHKKERATDGRYLDSR
jgi:signal transduction histidine kinase